MVSDEISNSFLFSQPNRVGHQRRGTLPIASGSSLLFYILCLKIPPPLGEGQGKGTSHESQSRSLSPPHSLNSDYFCFRRGAAAEEGPPDRVSITDRSS